MRYLSVMSRFHRYSVNNTMLIYMQKPDATLVAGYNKWKDQFERHVKKGEHGITIDVYKRQPQGNHFGRVRKNAPKGRTQAGEGRKAHEGQAGKGHL